MAVLCVVHTVVQGFGRAFVALDRERSGDSVYLHMKWRKVPNDAVTPDAPVTKFAIGVEGGFQTEDSKWMWEKTHSVVLFTPEPVVFP
jgi:hypothetical protein